jgi:hypothetical protein
MVDIFYFSFYIVGKQYSDAVTAELEFFDCNSQAFWNLKSYNDDYALLMQGNSENKLA